MRHQTNTVRDEREICAVERARSRGRRGPTTRPCSVANHALVTAELEFADVTPEVKSRYIVIPGKWPNANGPFHFPG